MVLSSIPPLIIAAICFYVGLYHFVLFLRQPDDKLNLTFALLAVSIGVYDVFCFGLYNSTSLTEGVMWQRNQLAVANIISSSLAMFVLYLSRKLFKTLLICVSGLFIIFFLIVVFIHNDFTLSLNNPAIKHFSIFNNEITYFEGTPGILFTIQSIIQFLIYTFLIYILVTRNKVINRKYMNSIIVSLIIFLFSILNDMLVAARVYVFIYTVEYSFLIVILSMTNLLLHNFVDLKNSLVKQLYTDSLTNLPNRTKLLVDIEKIKNPFIVLINIDSFKEINNFYGNETGDFVLIEIVERLKKLSTNCEYVIYKMQGDEYAILFDIQILPYVAKNILVDDIVGYIFREINDNTFKYKNNEINVRVTIGVADYDSIEKIKSRLILKNKVLINADMVLKEAKKVKKSFLIFNNSMEINKEYEKNIFWADKLKKAIKDDRIKPFYQPIITNTSGKIEKYECLVRMIDMDGKVISPNNFLGISQKIRLYSEITGIVINKSFSVFNNTDYEFSINLSIIDILDQETNHLIKSMLKENKDIAPRVVFEILESEGISNYDVMTDFISEIKSLGCKLAIDDFGSGYSNFDYIIKLKVDYIKIDASIIKNLDKDRNSYIIAKMINNAAKELGLLTIAEFVHSIEVYEKCVELGIDYSQGFYFSEPKENI